MAAESTSDIATTAPENHLANSGAPTVLPPFAILDECTFWNEKKKAWVKVDESRLKRLAKSINDKFKRTGEYLPIAPGHTVDGLPEEHQPRVIGGAVNAEVREYVNPRTGEPQGFKALYVTPIADPGEAKTFKALSRGRSVELWLDPDDISLVGLLGSNAPRRDLGPHLFTRDRNGVRHAEHGMHRFAKSNGRDDEPSTLTIDDQGNEMADEKNNVDDHDEDDKAQPFGGKPDDDSDIDNAGDDDSDSPEIQKLLAAFLNSDLGKRLEAAVTMMETMAGGQGGQPGPAGAGDHSDYDDLFSPQAGAGAPPPGGAPTPPTADPAMSAAPPSKPPEKMSAGNFSQAGPYNSPPSYPETKMSRTNESDLIRMSRLEESNARLSRQVQDLLKVNLQHAIAEELRVLETDGVIFDYDREMATMMRLEKKEDRDAHREHMIKFYKRQEDQLPNGGRLPIHAGAVATPTRFARSEPSFSDDNDVAAVAEEVAKRRYELGDKTASVASILAERAAKASPNGTVQVR